MCEGRVIDPKNIRDKKIKQLFILKIYVTNTSHLYSGPADTRQRFVNFA